MPIRPNALWALDFQFDTTVDGRTLKMLNVIDEFTRECLAIEVDRSIDADHVVAVLDRLARQRGGAPALVRFDNGPEFIAIAVADWCRFNACESVFIDPGSPWQNAWIESFNGRFRDEFLDGRHFDNLLEARVLIEDWRIDYNINRPHSAHGDLSQPSSPPSGPSTNPSRIATGPLNGSPSQEPARNQGGSLTAHHLVRSPREGGAGPDGRRLQRSVRLAQRCADRGKSHQMLGRR